MAQPLSVPPAEQTMMEKATELFNSFFGTAKQKSQEVADKAKEISAPIQETATNVIHSTMEVIKPPTAKPTESPEQKSNKSTAVIVFVGVAAAVIAAQTGFIVYTSMKGSKRGGDDAKPAAEAPPAATPA